MIVYVDVLLAVNGVITYFLLLTSALISGYTYNRKRIIAAAAVGALFCLYIFADTESGLINFFFKLSSLCICSVIAFGFKNKRKLAVQSVFFAALNMLLTGIIIFLSGINNTFIENNLFYYLDINPLLLVTVSVVIYLLLFLYELTKDGFSSSKKYVIDIYLESCAIKNVTGFYDSGFNIKDIISNKDVIILSAERIKEKLSCNLYNDIVNFDMEKYEDVKITFTPVFYSTVNGKGILPAVKAEYIIVNKTKIENVLVAFTLNELSENIEAIFGKYIKRQI